MSETKPVISTDGKMYVYYKTRYYDAGKAFKRPTKWEIAEHKLLRVEYCCVKMAQHFGQREFYDGVKYGDQPRVIDFGHHHDPHYTRNKGEHSTQVTLVRPHRYNSDPQETYYDYVPIKFCPFCGKPIESHQEAKVQLLDEAYTETVTKYKEKEVPFE